MSKKRFKIIAKDGVNIAVHVCSPGKDSVKAIVIVCHGFGEHAGCYQEFAEHLEQAGYASAVLTQRGHGILSKDPEKRKKRQGIIPSYQSLLDDIETVTAYIKQELPDLPVVLYGHSMGGNIAANYLLRHGQSDFSCVILEAPWFGLHREVCPFTVAMAKLGGRISPYIAIIKKLKLNEITSDRTKADAIGNDELYHNQISARMFSGIKSGCSYALRNAAKLSVPVFLASAANDTIVSNKAIRAFAKRYGGSVRKRQYQCCHSIHNDIKRKDFYRDLAAFLDAYSQIQASAN